MLLALVGVIALVGLAALVAPTSEPTSPPGSPPTSDPDAEPTSPPGSPPTSDPDAEPTWSPDAQPTSDPETEPTSDPDAEPNSPPGSPSEAPRAAPERFEAPTPWRTFTIAAAGDILPHTPVIDRAAEYDAAGDGYDFRPMFDDIAPVLRAADLAVCHLEAPLSADNADVFGGGDHRTEGGAPLFVAPWPLADAIAHAGFTACSTAHNHSWDAGEAGVTATLDALERVGVTPAGTARTLHEAGRTRMHDVGGVTVAHLSATYGLNVPPPQDQAWMVDVIDTDAIVAEAEASRDVGAAFVVVSLHHGIEYQVEPSDNQRARTDELLASDAIDVLIGHHAHVVQPIERVHDKVAVHGLGNLLSNMRASSTGQRTQDGVIVLLEVTEDPDRRGFSVTAVEYVPTRVDPDGHVVRDVGAALEVDATDPLNDPLDDRRRREFEDSWDRTVDAVTRDGADAWGVAPTSGPAWVRRQR